MVLPTLTLTGNEMIEHDEGFVTMRLHCELPNGAHYFIDEDDWHVGLGDDATNFAQKLNSQLKDSDVVVAQVVGDDANKLTQNVYGAYIFTIVDRNEFAPEDLMSEEERYAHEQCLDADWDFEMQLDREYGFTRGR